MRRRLSMIAVGVLVLAGSAAPAQAAPGASARTTDAPAAESTAAVATGASDPGRTVTLVTGDHVTVLPGGSVTVHPGPGRRKIPMLTSTAGGHTTVVPADAIGALRAGRLDQRLFDVTSLLAGGFSDRRADLPLIVSDTAATAAQDSQAGPVRRHLTSVRASVVRARKRDVGKLWNTIRTRPAGTGKVWLDASGHLTGAEGVEQIGAPTAWAAGLTGTGVTVGLIDSGIDTGHPDLAGKVAVQEDFSPLNDGGTAPTTGTVHDVDGHGTGVASILAGSGAASGGKYRGVAPDVRLVSARVSDDDGFIAESTVIAAMEWMATAQHAKVVNISLGFPDSAGVDPLEAALNDLTAQDHTLFVVAVGNDGNNDNDPRFGNDYQLLSPSTADAALSVGAVDHQDQLAGFSSRGPRPGDDAMKPDITAPGSDITVAVSQDAYGGPGPYESGGFGTSYAAPHVTGSAAILAERHPDWTPQMLKAALMGTARPSPAAGAYAQGAGRVDIPLALADTVVADPPSVSFPSQTGPHTGANRVTRTITYRNTGAGPVTLALSLTMHQPGGGAVPAGLFDLGAQSLTVPAGGTATTTVNATDRPAAVDGTYYGTVAASGGGQHVATPIGVVRQAQQHQLTIDHLDVTGAPAQGLDYQTEIVGLDTPFYYNSIFHWDPTVGSQISVPVPTGRYAILSSQITADGDNWDMATTAQPDVEIDADRTLTVDPRVAEPVTVTGPRAGAAPQATAVNIAVKTLTGWTSHEFTLFSGGRFATGQVGTSGGAGEFTTDVRAIIGGPGYSDAGSWIRPGALPTGFSATLGVPDLAVIHPAVHPEYPGDAVYEELGPAPAGYPVAISSLEAPAGGTLSVLAAPGLRWQQGTYEDIEQGDVFGALALAGPVDRYQPGRTYRQSWGYPVLGPCAATGPDWDATWYADRLSIRQPQICDAAGHGGTSDGATGDTVLTTGGATVQDSETPGTALFQIHPDGRPHHLITTAQEATLDGLSTRTTIDWTVTARPGPLPLASVLFRPTLDATGGTPAGAALRIPMTVQQTGGAPVTAIKLEISYDDGRTWQPASTARTATGGWVATVANPTTGGYASLRATATGNGTAVRETILHAYRIAAS